MNVKPRVLFIFQFTFKISGNNSSFLQIAQILKHDFEIYFAMPDKEGIYDIITDEQRAKTFIITQNDSSRHKFKRLYELLNIIKRNKIDIVMHHFLFDSASMVVLKILSEIQIILYFGASRLGWKHRLYSHFYDRIMLKSEQTLRSSLKRERKLETIPFRRTSLIAFDSSLFFVHKSPNRDRIIHEINKTVIGFMGRIDNEVKGLFDLVAALAVLNKNGDYSLQIMGDVTSRKPKDKEALIEKAKFEGVLDKIEFLGATVCPEEKKRFFEGIDILCLPSIEEGSPVVVFEAVSFLVPVVATRVGSLPLYFTNEENILFVETRNPCDLAKKIERLARDKALRGHIIEKLREFIERIESDQLDRQLVDIFKSI